MKWRIISWNVNGIRSLHKKGELNKLIEKNKPDIICFSETKLSCPCIEICQKLKKDIKGFRYRFYNPCIARKGYAGTMIFSKRKPLSIINGIENEELDKEGRVITLEFKNFYLVNVYTPNSGHELKRLKYRINQWDVAFRKYITKLGTKKTVIIAGDLNVAHKEIDIHNPQGNKRNAGFTDEERTSFDLLLKESQLIDTFRYLNPKQTDVYSYWSYMHKARQKNKGWRIDYFLISNKSIQWVKKVNILKEQMGSDHAPVSILLNITNNKI